MSITPRPYQADLIRRTRARIAAGYRRVCVQAAVGAGKTIVSSEIVRLAVAKGKSVLFLAHRRRLIEQKSGKLAGFGVPHGVLMSGRSSRPDARVQVASRDTLLSRAVRNDWMRPPPADLVIVDEAHRVMSDEYQRLLAFYPDAVHLGLTATPAREDGKGLGDFYEAIECCVPLRELIAGRFIVPVRCFAPQNRKAARRKLAGDPVESWRRHGEGRPTILFATTVAASEAAAQAFNASGIPAEHLDADTPDAQRDAIIARVEAGATRVLCNCNVMTEGVDVPCLSCVILLRLASSYVLYIQAVGRVMRAFPGKADAVLVDHADAVLEHGFPDEDVRWELTESETVDARNKADRKAGKRATPVTCQKCGLIYRAAASCPKCGYRLPRKSMPTILKKQLLTEVEKTLTPQEKAERRVRYWFECLRVMAHKGMTCGAAAGMFRGRYKEGPDESLPNFPQGRQWKQRVAEAFPQYAPGERRRDED
jgi:superfamily II DNA or RNA helicase